MVQDSLDNFVKEYNARSLLRDMVRFMRPYKGRFFAATLFRISGDIVALYPAYAFAAMVTFLSQYESNNSLNELWITLGLFGAAIITRAVLVGIAKYMAFNVAERVSLDTQLVGTQHMMRLDLNWHETENVGSRVKKVQRAGDSMNRLIRIWIGNLTEIVVNFVGMIIIISQISTTIAGVLIVFITIFFTISRILVRYAADAAHVVNKQEDDFHGVLFQAAQNIRTVKAIGAIEKINAYLHNMAGSLAAAIKRRVFFFQGRAYGLAVFTQAVRVFSLAYIGYGISQGSFEIGFLVLFSGYFNSLWMSVEEFSNVSQEYVVSKQSIARFSAMLSQPFVIEALERTASLPDKWKSIVFEGVSFSYGDQIVLDNISFTLKRGERLGLVGLSGAGKSTLMKLLLKEYEPTSGRILIDGLDITSINRDLYIQKVAVVLQETEVFNFSLRDNITISSVGRVNKKRLDKALSVAHVGDYLNKLPQGLDTLIGEKGVKLSGGEKQRLGLARAIYKNPQLLLLDEATSHLDTESEQKIQESLHVFFQEVSAVVIAHRLTTVKQMDRILVIENGRLLEVGSFGELLAKNGRFAELWSKQAVE